MNRIKPNYKDNRIAHIPNIESYQELYKESINNPEKFWEEQANRLTWFNKWESVKDVDYKSAHIKWFEGGEINSKDLKEFLMKWEDKLSFKTVVKQGFYINTSEFIWFDIIPINTPSSPYKRFEYQYSDSSKILDGLQEFYNVAKFTTSDKPAKKQKRNDYEY